MSTLTLGSQLLTVWVQLEKKTTKNRHFTTLVFTLTSHAWTKSRTHKSTASGLTGKSLAGWAEGSDSLLFHISFHDDHSGFTVNLTPSLMFSVPLSVRTCAAYYEVYRYAFRWACVCAIVCFKSIIIRWVYNKEPCIRTFLHWWSA